MEIQAYFQDSAERTIGIILHHCLYIGLWD